MGAGLAASRAVWPYASYFFEPYRVLAGVLIAVMGLSALLEMMTIGLLLPLFGELMGMTTQPVGGELLAWLDLLIDCIPLDDRILKTVSCLLLVGCGAEISKFAVTTLVAQFTATARGDVGVKTFDHVLHADPRRLLAAPQGEWIHRVVTAPFQMTTLFSLSPLLLVQVFRTGALLTLLLLISVPLTIGVLLCGGLLFAAMRHLGRRYLFALGADQVKATEQQTAVANEAIGGMREISIYQATESWNDRFRKATAHYTAQAMKQVWLQHLPTHLIPLAVLGVVGLGMIGLQATAGVHVGLWIPTLAVFVAAFGRIAGELAACGKYHMQIVSMLPFSAAVHQELVTPNPPLDRTKSGVHIESPHTIVFDRVRYRHPGRAATLEGVSFTLKRGEATALVGVSGSGKSTLLDLLLGLYEPDEGRISVDGWSLHQLNIAAWRARVGFVGQDAFLFHGSIEDNVLLERRVSEERLAESLHLARVDRSLASSRSDLSRMVGNRGAELSGGERQRVALARALLTNPNVLILDEGASNLEAKMEAELVDDLVALTRNGILLVVTHRLSSVMNVRQIVVMDEGRVSQIGTHEDLLRHGGSYARLWRAQEPIR